MADTETGDEPSIAERETIAAAPRPRPEAPIHPAAPPAPDVSRQADRTASGYPLEGVSGLRDTIFERLVDSEEDVVGLLAYSLSMQNKRDWLAAFQAEMGRDPTAAEMGAYDIGERITRRLATYRKLAEHALAGNASWASAALTPVSEMPGAPAPEPASTYTPAPRPAPVKTTGVAANKGRIAVAGGIFVLLVVAAITARHILGV